MKNKYSTLIVYTGIFSIAYAGFFYQRYTSTPDIDTSVNTIESEIITSIEAAQEQNVLSTNRTYTGTYIRNDNNNPDIKMSNLKLNNKETLSNKNAEPIRDATPSVSSTYTASLKNRYEENYSQENSRYDESTAQTVRSNTGYANTLNTAFVNISNTKASNSKSLSISNDVDTTGTDRQPVFAESDGSEFLPDGSSQEDSYVSQLKKPRVYTIKDYQTANISCTAGYNDSSASHAALIKGLKGC